MMQETLRRMVSPPRFPGDETRTRRAGLLHALVLALVLAVSLNLATLLLSGPLTLVTVLAGLLEWLLLAGAWLALRRGYTTTVGLALATLMLLLQLALLSAGEATTALTQGVALLLVAIAGLSLHPWAALGAAGISAAITATALLNPPLPPLFPLPAGSLPLLPASLTQILAMGLIIFLAARSAESAIRAAGETARSLERAYRRLKQRAGREAALGHFAARLNSDLDPPALYQAICEETARVLSVPATSLSLFDQASGRLVHGSDYGLPPSYHQAVRAIWPEEGIPDPTPEQPFTVLSAGTPAWSQDPNAALYEATGIVQLITAPIRRGGERLGSLTVHQTGQPRAFSRDDFELLSSLAELVAQALVNASRLETVERQRDLAETLRDVTTAISRATTLAEIYDILIAYLERIIPHDACVVMEVSGDIVRIVRAADRAGRGFDEGRLQQTFSMPISKTAHLRQMAESGRPVLVADTDTFPGWVKHPETAWVRSCVGAPIKVRQKVYGFALAHRAVPRAYTDLEAGRLGDFVERAALGIENLQLLGAEKRQRAQAEGLLAANLALARSLRLEEVLPALLEQLQALVPYDSANVMLRQGEREVAVAVGAGSETFGDFEQTRQFTFDLDDNPIVAEVVRGGRPVLIPDTGASPHWQVRPGAEHVRSWIGVPLPAGGEVIGLYSLDKAEPGFFTAEHVRLAEAMAPHAAIAVQNARLFQQVREYAATLEARVTARTAELEHLYHRQEALAQIELAINQPHELHNLLDQVAQVTTHYLPASGGASVILWQEQEERFFVSASTVPAQPREIASSRVRRSGGASRWIVEHRQPLVVENTEQDPFGANRMLAEFGMRAYAGIPLLAEERVLGVLYALDTAPRPYTAQDIEFLQALANRAAAAIVKVELYQSLQAATTLAQEHAARLEEANQELEGFAYTVSHDLKAPLRGISGYASELDRRHREGLSDRGRFCVDQVIAASSRLDELIEDLLHYARLEREVPTQEWVDVPALVQTLLNERQESIAASGAQVTVSLPSNRVQGWASGLMQILANLIDNGLKYSRQAKPPRLEIGGEVLPGAYQIWVRDNGIGFDMKYHDRIFGLFNRLVRQEQYEGTGAGLAIASRAAAKLGGRLWAESVPGEGATFYLSLPRGEQPSGSAGPA